jgi:hypothetical protein
MRALRFQASLRSVQPVVLSVYERRRITILGIVTILALTVVRVSGIGDSADTTTTTLTATSTTVVTDESIPDPVILGGPAPLAPSGSAVIAYPATMGNEINGLATFSNLGYTQTPVCYSTQVPAGAIITVTNVNNGRTLKCTSVFSLLVPPGMTIMMHISLFTNFANLNDAPLPVKISW